jgi:hypothetical protein
LTNKVIGVLSIYGNKFLKGLHGLKNFKKVRTIGIGDNDSLTTMHGLHVDSVFYSLSIGDYFVNQENSLLKNHEGLNVKFLKRLWLSNNLSLEDLTGSNIMHLDMLAIRNNNTMKKIAELKPRESIEIGFSSQ